MRGEEASNSAGTFLPTEIPPRARGRAHDTKKHSLPAGNTPACAGKRHPWRASVRPSQKYPRVRGEEVVMMPDGWPVAEIPPRARGRAPHPQRRVSIPGNTPACAGKRRSQRVAPSPIWKYPRVRGEEPDLIKAIKLGEEIPPRARGRASYARIACWHFGNTPACAGKSLLCAHSLLALRKYLRVRGEESTDPARGSLMPEIPPRARGREVSARRRAREAGNTPACAGKSHTPPPQSQQYRKYPRVRGEECTHCSSPLALVEIPPRARGRVD